jgi:hypothetical protein
MRLGAIRRNFIKVAGKHPRGWDDIWPAFVAVIREPLEEPDILYDIVLLEIGPAYPPYSHHDGVVLSRKVGIRGSVKSYNELEAAFVVSAEWKWVDVGSKAFSIAGRGPSSYEHDPAPPVDEFVAEVEKLPAVAALRGADAAFHRCQASYQRPQERD